jgi:polyribonucleotide nucleotidyltransferase
METLEMLIPQYSVGRIIGRSGETIREIQSRSRCRVEVERGGPSSDISKSKICFSVSKFLAMDVHFPEKKVSKSQNADLKFHLKSAILEIILMTIEQSIKFSGRF